MGENERTFRERIARIGRVQIIQEETKQRAKEESTQQEDLLEVMPAICGVKKSIENFRNNTKEIVNEER